MQFSLVLRTIVCPYTLIIHILNDLLISARLLLITFKKQDYDLLLWNVSFYNILAKVCCIFYKKA